MVAKQQTTNSVASLSQIHVCSPQIEQQWQDSDNVAMSVSIKRATTENREKHMYILNELMYFLWCLEMS